jgi:hypothetical protein
LNGGIIMGRRESRSGLGTGWDGDVMAVRRKGRELPNAFIFYRICGFL